MTNHYVDANGVYIGGFDEESSPEGGDLISLGSEIYPSYADQIWLFPGWSESPSQLRKIETEWRDSEMIVAKENVTAIEYGDETIPGTEAQWKAYWLALRKWQDPNPDYPDTTKRPVKPT